MLDRSRLGRSLETVAYLSRNWKFESISLQRGVLCEPDLRGRERARRLVLAAKFFWGNTRGQGQR